MRFIKMNDGTGVIGIVVDSDDNEIGEIEFNPQELELSPPENE